MTGLRLRRRTALRSLPLALAPAAARLSAGLRAPELVQDRLRRRIAAQVARTQYGRSHGIEGPGDFSKLPVVDYEALRPWVDRQRSEEGHLLCAEPVLFYERTSGSSGPAKYIPYTRSLRWTFSEMFRAWAYDLLQRAPKLRTGKTFISVSPQLGPPETTAHGKKVGLDDDAEYLEGWMQRLLRPFLVAPRHRRHADATAFKDAVARCLLAEPDLEVISVWNPSFLEVILDHIEAERTSLARDLPSSRRELLLAPSIDWTAVWPSLALLSCWDQGAAAPMATRLRKRLPHAFLQGKGLLATEAPLTVPWIHAAGCVPLVHTTVIELREDDGSLLPLHAARPGRSYEVVVSPLGGFPRYRLGDRVEVTHRYHAVPSLRFVGREGGVSDLVGEKLQEHFVQDVLEETLPPSGALRTLVPLAGPPARYALLTDEPVPVDAAHRVDQALARAHHYGLARSLGQLAPLAVVHSPEAARWVAEREMRRGLAWGDIKPRVLQLHAADGVLAQHLNRES